MAVLEWWKKPSQDKLSESAENGFSFIQIHTDEESVVGIIAVKVKQPPRALIQQIK